MERKEWDPKIGVVGPVDLPYLETLVAWLMQARATDGTCTTNDLEDRL